MAKYESILNPFRMVMCVRIPRIKKLENRIYVKKGEYERSNWYTSDLLLGN